MVGKPVLISDSEKAKARKQEIRIKVAIEKNYEMAIGRLIDWVLDSDNSPCIEHLGTSKEWSCIVPEPELDDCRQCIRNHAFKMGE